MVPVPVVLGNQLEVLCLINLVSVSFLLLCLVEIQALFLLFTFFLCEVK